MGRSRWFVSIEPITSTTEETVAQRPYVIEVYDTSGRWHHFVYGCYYKQLRSALLVVKGQLDLADTFRYFGAKRSVGYLYMRIVNRQTGRLMAAWEGDRRVL